MSKRPRSLLRTLSAIARTEASEESSTSHMTTSRRVGVASRLFFRGGRALGLRLRPAKHDRSLAPALARIFLRLTGRGPCLAPVTTAPACACQVRHAGEVKVA